MTGTRKGQEMQWQTLLAGRGIDHEARRIEKRLPTLEVFVKLGKHFERRRKRASASK